VLGLQVAARELKIEEALLQFYLFTKVAHNFIVIQVHLLKFNVGHLFTRFRNALGEDSQVLDTLNVDV